MRRPSGAWEMPRRMISWVGMPVMLRAVVDDAAGAGAIDAADGHHEGGLAGPVGADESGDFALVHLHIDTAQRLDAPIERLNAADGEQRFCHALSLAVLRPFLPGASIDRLHIADDRLHRLIALPAQRLQALARRPRDRRG